MGIVTNAPQVGDNVIMIGVETVIEIKSVPTHQPRSVDGVFSITDQYDEIHLIEEGDGDDNWVVIIPPI